jgi:multiple sugar transport system substrate-binding protein
MKSASGKITVLAFSLAVLLAIPFYAQAKNAAGQGFSYDATQSVNGGKPIELEFWTWGTLDLFKELGGEYTKAHPNVTFKFVENGWDDYWTKLPLAIKSGTGPDCFNFHNSKEDTMLQYMAPYAMDVAQLRASYMGIDSHLKSGKLYYTDYGFMTGAIYYNKKLWKEAGLTERDVPKTWTDFVKVARKLTKYDAKGNIAQAGFNYNGNYQAIIEGLDYQKGQLLFKSDKKTVDFDNPATVANTKFLLDLYQIEKVGSKDFGTDSGQSFGQGNTAMVYEWGWFKNYLPENFPDLEWGVFNTPSPYSDKKPFAYDRYNGESTFGINKFAKPEKQAVAQDFVKFFMADERMLEKFCLMFGTFPAKMSMNGDPAIQADPLMKELSKIIDRTIWPGVIPSPIEDNLKRTIQDILYNGMSVESAVQKTQKQMTRDLAQSTFVSVESQYKYFGERKNYQK